MSTTITRTLVLGTAVLSVAALQGTTSAWAQPPKAFDVTVSNSALEPIPTYIVHPVSTTPVAEGEPFTIAPRQIALVPAGGPIAPDSSGTRYAITSLTGINPSDQPVTISTRSIAIGGVGGGGCTFAFNLEDTTDGPEIRIPPNDTMHITFPQPFITAAVVGTQVCFVAAGSPSFIGVKWSVTGYKILP